MLAIRWPGASPSEISFRGARRPPLDRSEPNAVAGGQDVASGAFADADDKVSCSSARWR